jgi:hypothetical protein
MASGFIAKQLVKYLGDYVEDAERVFDPANISIGPFSGGEIEFLDVALRTDALASMDLPIDVAFGKIGRLKVNFSLKKLELVIQDVVAVVRPRINPANFDEGKEVEARAAAKKKALKSLDAKIKAAQAAAKKGGEKQGWGEYLAMGAANFVQIPVTIERVHIRVEHEGDRDFPSHFGLGIRLDLLELRTPDDAADRAANLRERDGTNAPASLVKTLRVAGLCVYVDSESVAHAAAARGASFDAAAVAKLGRPSAQTQYVLAPLSMEILVVYNNNAGKRSSVPQMDVALSLDPALRVQIGQWYLKRIILLANCISSYKAYARYQRFRPLALPAIADAAPVALPAAATATAPPSKLWRYALAALKAEAAPAMRQRLFARIGRTLLVRPRYVEVYCYKLDPKWHQNFHLKEKAAAHKEDDAELAAMEVDLTVGEITAFRTQAERLLGSRKEREERATADRATHEAQLAKERSQRSWGEWWAGTALPSEEVAPAAASAEEEEADLKVAAELRSIYDEARSQEFKPSWETVGGEDISMRLHVEQGATRRDHSCALNLELVLVADEPRPSAALRAGATRLSANARGELYRAQLARGVERSFYRHPASDALAWARPAPGSPLISAAIVGIGATVTMRSKYMDVAFVVDDLRVAHHRGGAEFGTLPQFAQVRSSFLLFD